MHAEFAVVSAGLNDPEQGLSESELDQTDVLIWWGHVRQAEVKPEKGKGIVKRIKAGSLSLIALLSAHWSTPFVESMNEITRLKVFSDPAVKEADVSFVSPRTQFTTPKSDSRLKPYTDERKFPDGRTTLQVHLPFCCFPTVRNDGKPSNVKVLWPRHPIMKSLPANSRKENRDNNFKYFHTKV